MFVWFMIDTCMYILRGARSLFRALFFFFLSFFLRAYCPEMNQSSSDPFEGRKLGEWGADWISA